jgi:hypothetical protein
MYFFNYKGNWIVGNSISIVITFILLHTLANKLVKMFDRRTF